VIPARYAILVDVIQTLICFEDWSSVSVGQDVYYNAYSTRECRSPTGCTDINGWRCRNCSCGTRAIQNLLRYRKRIGIIPVDGPWSTSGRSTASIRLLAECSSVSSRSFSMDAILRIAVTSTHCGWALFAFHSVERRSIFCVLACVQRPQESPLRKRS
jgi:hypothetical protein